MGRYLKLRLFLVATMLVVPVVGEAFGSVGGLLLVLLSGGIFFLTYVLAVSTRVGSLVGGLALLAVTIATEVYVAGRWPASSTAPLGYLYLVFAAPPIVALVLFAEGLTAPVTRRAGAMQRLPEQERMERLSHRYPQDGRRPRALTSLLVAEALAALWAVFGCFLFISGTWMWCLLSASMAVAGGMLIVMRLWREKTSTAQPM